MEVLIEANELSMEEQLMNVGLILNFARTHFRPVSSNGSRVQRVGPRVGSWHRI
jgi:hypothetical protein